MKELHIDDIRRHEARFWGYITKDKEHWLWNGPYYPGTKGGGAGAAFFLRKTSRSAVKVAWLLVHGTEAPFRLIRRKYVCDEPRCVNPEHFGPKAGSDLTMDDLLDLPTEATCSKCGITKPKAEMVTHKSSTGYRYHGWCRDCSNAQGTERRRKKRSTVEGVVGEIARKAIDRAKGKGQEPTITPEFLVQMYHEQGGLCALTGLPLDVSSETETEWRRNPHRVSVDKIDPKGTYTTDNVRLVLYAMNVALLDWGEEVIHPIMRAFVARQAA